MSDFMVKLQGIPWSAVLGTTPLEIIATVSAVVGVFLIARQNVLGWPLGLVWAGISAYLAFHVWHLVSDGILFLTYIPIQLYCWWAWVRHGGPRQAQPFTPTWLPCRTQVFLVVAALASIASWAWAVSTLAATVSWIPTPALLVRDATATVLNFYAQFLQARKHMENWVVWLVVNIISIHIFWVKDSPIYSIQYAFFLVLGIYGWIQWRKSMHATPPVAA